MRCRGWSTLMPVLSNAPGEPARHGVDNGLRAGVQCSTTMNTGARATGLRGRLPCRRPDEPDLGNTSVGRRSVCVVMPLEIAPAAFFLLVTYQEGGTEMHRPTTET